MQQRGESFSCSEDKTSKPTEKQFVSWTMTEWPFLRIWNCWIFFFFLRYSLVWCKASLYRISILGTQVQNIPNLQITIDKQNVGQSQLSYKIIHIYTDYSANSHTKWIYKKYTWLILICSATQRECQYSCNPLFKEQMQMTFQSFPMKAHSSSSLQLLPHLHRYLCKRQWNILIN